jgi:hypothetical protein
MFFEKKRQNNNKVIEEAMHGICLFTMKIICMKRKKKREYVL